jgi:8-oxo-dGTP diphosphatase
VTDRNPLHVVAAVIFRDSKVLACRRAPHKAAAGEWEFPGGKLEAGEKPHAALAREIFEEMGIVCRPLRTLDISDTRVGTTVVRLETVICKIDDSACIQSTDHDAFLWLEVGELASISWAKPDLPAVQLLLGQDNLDPS